MKKPTIRSEDPNKRRARLVAYLKGPAGVTPKNVAGLVKKIQLADEDDTGTIEYDEFCKGMGLKPNDETADFYAFFDMEKTGKVNTMEMVMSFVNLIVEDNDRKLELAYEIFDTNGDSIITRDELLSMLKATHMVKNIEIVRAKGDSILRQKLATAPVEIRAGIAAVAQVPEAPPTAVQIARKKAADDFNANSIGFGTLCGHRAGRVQNRRLSSVSVSHVSLSAFFFPLQMN